MSNGLESRRIEQASLNFGDDTADSSCGRHNHRGEEGFQCHTTPKNTRGVPVEQSSPGGRDPKP